MTRSLMVADDDLPDDVALAIQGAGSVAWDIETTSLDWTAGRIATCQVATSDMAVVVKLAEGSQPARLRSLLADASVAKVFHHAPFDLRFMASSWSVVPAKTRCTKIASKILHPHLSPEEHSLRPVVKRHLGVDIDKGQQTSDWARSALTDEQIRYAVNDVVHLLPLLAVLTSQLEAVGRLDVLEASYDYLPTRVRLDLAGVGDVYRY